MFNDLFTTTATNKELKFLNGRILELKEEIEVKKRANQEKADVLLARNELDKLEKELSSL